MQEKISALMDGELSGEDAASVIGNLRKQTDYANNGRSII